jgi:hypothetical protein
MKIFLTQMIIKDLIVLHCTPLSSILALNLSLPVCSCFVALTLFLKDAMVGRHNEYLSQVFTFPKSAKKQLVVKNENIPNTNDNLSEEKSKMIVSHYETVIVRLTYGKFP